VFIAPLLKQRIGVLPGLAWACTGLVLIYNACYNHAMALLIKPGNPKDL